MVPKVLSDVAEYILELERQNTEKDETIEKLKNQLERTAFDTSDAELLLSKADRRLSDAQFRIIIPIPASNFNQRIADLIADGTFTIKPAVVGTHKREWLVRDVLKLVKDLGGERLGFYRVEDVRRLRSWETLSAVYQAEKNGMLPKRLKIGNTTMFVKERIHEALNGEWRSVA